MNHYFHFELANNLKFVSFVVLFGQICIPIACPKSKLLCPKIIKLDVQTRPIFTDPVTYLAMPYNYMHDNKSLHN